MTKVRTLFDLTKLESRKTADQEEFEDLHKHDLPEFYKIFRKALELTKAESKSKPRHFKNRNFHANTMNCNIIGLLREKFPDEVKDGPNDRVMFSRNGKFCIYFKKLNERKMPNNVRTDYVELVAFQKTIPGGDKMPIIFVGFTVEDDWSELTGIYAVYIEGNRRVWVTTINDAESGEAGMAVPVIGGPTGPVTPKAKRAKRKTGS